MNKRNDSDEWLGQVVGDCIAAALAASLWILSTATGLVRDAYSHHTDRLFFTLAGAGYSVALCLALVLVVAGRAGLAVLLAGGSSVVFVASCAVMDRVYLLHDRRRVHRAYDESLTSGAWWKDD